MPIKKFSGKISGEGGHVKVGLPAEGGGGGGEPAGRVPTDSHDVMIFTLDESVSPWTSTGAGSPIVLSKHNVGLADPDIVDGLFNKGLSFAGPSTQYVYQGGGTHVENQLTSSLTLSAWFYPRVAGSGRSQTVISKNFYPEESGWSSPYSTIELGLNQADQARFRVTINTVGTPHYLVESTWSGVVFNRWNHIGITVDTVGGTATTKYYLNGVALDTNTWSVNSGGTTVDYSSSGGWSVGSNNNGDVLNGIVDDVRFADVARDSTWFADVYAGRLVALSSKGPVTSGLVSWVKADAGITKDGGDVVSAWADQSGNGTNWTVSGTGPTWIASAKNGLPVLRASGTGKALEQAAFLSGGQDAEVFVLVKAAKGSNGAWGGFGAYTALHAHYPYDYVYETFGLANDRVTYYNYSDTGHYNVYNISAASGSGAYVIRLGSVTSTYTQNIGWLTSKFYLFRDGLDNFQFEGDIGEILVYNRVLTSSERLAVNNYLIGRWNL